MCLNRERRIRSSPRGDWRGRGGVGVQRKTLNKNLHVCFEWILLVAGRNENGKSHPRIFRSGLHDSSTVGEASVSKFG